MLLAAARAPARASCTPPHPASTATRTTFPLHEAMCPRPEVALRRQQARRRGSRRRVHGARYGMPTVGAAVLQRLRAAARIRPERVRGGGPALHRGLPAPARAPSIHGDGEQSRDFTYIDDVVEANLRAARAPEGALRPRVQRRRRRRAHLGQRSCSPSSPSSPASTPDPVREPRAGRRRAHDAGRPLAGPRRRSATNRPSTSEEGLRRTVELVPGRTWREGRASSAPATSAWSPGRASRAWATTSRAWTPTRTRSRCCRAADTPFHEPDLRRPAHAEGLAIRAPLVHRPVAEAVEGAEVVFICVGRPPVGPRRPQPDRRGGRRARGRRDAAHGVVCGEVHRPPGTTGRVAQGDRAASGPTWRARSCPARSSCARATPWRTPCDPDRLVVGADDDRGRQVLSELYAPLLDGRRPLIETDPRTAELAKLASNAFLATKISFANALARVAELAGADVVGVTEIMGARPTHRTGVPGRRPRLRRLLPAEGHRDAGAGSPTASATTSGSCARSSASTTRPVEAVARKVEEAVWNLEGKRIAPARRGVQARHRRRPRGAGARRSPARCSPTARRVTA